MTKNPTAFISYSWDSPQHQKWVVNFANRLREKGIDATIDVFETQKGTTNLYSMMADNIRIKDFVLAILTNNYKERADKMSGGVGFETRLLLPLIQSNKDKIIPIIREKDKTDTVPFYLQGVYYIDFSDDTKFEEKFKELLYRLLDVPIYEASPLGGIPNLRSMNSKELNDDKFNDYSSLIPSFKKITDLDKNRFMKDSFEKMKKVFTKLLKDTKIKNPNFEYEQEDLTSKKVLFKMYIDGNLKYSIKMWVGSNFSKIDNINFSYGNMIYQGDNSMNEIVTCEIDSHNNLSLKRTMNIFSENESCAAEDIAKEIWKEIIHWI
jgi:hypothetical protein